MNQAFKILFMLIYDEGFKIIFKPNITHECVKIFGKIFQQTPKKVSSPAKQSDSEEEKVNFFISSQN